MSEYVLNLNKLLSKADWLDWDEGDSYYHRFHLRLFKTGLELGANGLPQLSMSQLCGLYAVLSPNNDERGNWADMWNVIRYGENAQCSSYPLNKAKAVRILNGEDPLVVLGGLKVMNFYGNLLEPFNTEFVTVDGHMCNICNNRLVSLKDRSLSFSNTTYLELKAAIQWVARDRGKLPNQIQATAWLTWKRIHNIRWSGQFRLWDFSDEVKVKS